MGSLKTEQPHRFHDLPGSLPTDPVSSDHDISSCSDFVKSSLESIQVDRFTEDALWRDWMCFSPQVRTRAHAAIIAKVWRDLSRQALPTDFRISSPQTMQAPTGQSWVYVPFEFRAQRNRLRTNCSGSAYLTPSSGTWKIWSLVTILENFEGHGDPDDPRPNLERKQSINTLGTAGRQHYQAVVLGAGQSGLSLSGRLGALGVSYLLVEKDDIIGSSWSKRYDSVRQHTWRETNNLPFDRTWNPDDETYLPGKRVGEGFQNYVKKYNINIVTSSQITHCARDTSTQTWLLDIQGPEGVSRVQAKHLIFSTGANLRVPKQPTISGQESYQGTVMHAAEYKNSKSWKGLSGLVIGSATNAHDVALDMVHAGMQPVHMIQRNKTPIFPISVLYAAEKSVFNLDIPVTIADRIVARPWKHHVAMADGHVVRQAKEPETARLHDGLEEKGFRVDREAGLLDLIYSKGGTYYIDVGACEEVLRGNITIKSGTPIQNFTPGGLAFADGTEIKSDVIIFATGYDADYQKQIAEVVGNEIASQVGQWWGLDEEGELRGLMRAVYPGLWMMGGAAQIARWASRFIALQIQSEILQAREEPASNGI